MPVLRKEAYLAITPVLEGLIRVLELIGMDRFKQVPNASGFSRDASDATTAGEQVYWKKTP